MSFMEREWSPELIERVPSIINDVLFESAEVGEGRQVGGRSEYDDLAEGLALVGRALAPTDVAA
jgi:hypothetical protein